MSSPGKACAPRCGCRFTMPPGASAEERAEHHRQYRERKMEGAREYAREYRAQNPEKVSESYRRWRTENREYTLERNRQWRMENRDKLWVGELRRRHDGMTPGDWQAMWDAQGGRCYLCADPLDGLRAVIEHDHDCCPQNKSCARCRRGLACGNCNSLVGFAGDDPGRLERIASNFKAAAAAARERIAEPAELPIDIKRAARRREESALWAWRPSGGW